MKRLIPGVLGLGVFLSLSTSAFATSVNVDFTFDAQTIGTTNIAGLASGATASQIATYMDQVLTASGCSGCSVSVLSNGTAGAVADQTYTGEGNVVGVGGSGTGKVFQPVTLGTTNGAVNNNAGTSSNTSGNGALNAPLSSTSGASYDTFIANTNDSSGNISSQITLQFSGFTGKSLTVTGFNYEIFPDGTCSTLSSTNCGGTSSSTPSGFANQPDLEFQAGNNTNGSDALQDTFWGVTPGSSGSTNVLETNGSGSTVLSGSDGSSTKDSASGATGSAPQAIGNWSGTLTGVSELDFVDWPATIGIDNLQISFTNTSPVPEPAGIALFGTLVVLLTRKLRKTS